MSVLIGMSLMIKQVSVMKANWDYLVILDACRYDYFSELYQDYLHGRLEKVISLGSSTLEWCKKSFQEVYRNVIYISANPYISSKGKVKGFRASDHFYKVIDVWDWGWDKELGTVHPCKVNEVVQRVKDDYPSKRLIIHYLQPHAPYIGNNPHASGFPRPQLEHGHPLVGIQNWQNHGFFEVRLEKLLAILTKPAEIIDRNFLWKICELLKLSPVSPMDSMRRKFGDNGLELAYVENLRLALEYAAKLIGVLPGEIVITADHGECLGEKGRYSHSDGCRDPLLLEIPWLVVEKTVAKVCSRRKEEKRAYVLAPETTEKQEEEKIRKKLRNLGYL